MTPRNKPEDNCGSTTPDEAVDEEDLAEIEAVSESLDSLNNALDMIEEQTSSIKERLLELLNSNKEVRESLMAERAQNVEGTK